MQDAQKCCSLCGGETSDKKVFYQPDADLWKAVDVCQKCYDAIGSMLASSLQESLKAGLLNKIGFIPVHLRKSTITQFFKGEEVEKIKEAQAHNIALMKARMEQRRAEAMRGM